MHTLKDISRVQIHYFRKTRNIITALFLLQITTAVYGAQTFKVNDGDSIKVKVSANELTRIAITGSGRIKNIWGASGVLEIMPDKDKGELFLRPKSHAKKSFSFFIRDSYDNTYTLIGVQHDIPSQSILLTPNQKLDNLEQQIQTADPKAIYNAKIEKHESHIKKLIKHMVESKKMLGYAKIDINHDYPLWQEAHVVHKMQYKGIKAKGDQFMITNITDQPMQLHETELLSLFKDVLAVSIEHLKLEPGMSTYAYVISKNSRQIPR